MKNFIPIKLALCLLALCGLTGCNGESALNSDTQFLLNTFITLTAECGDEELDAAFELCREYEGMLSRTDENSEIFKLNASGELEVSEETAKLVNKALYYSDLSGGRFDITICPVSELWDFNNQVIPSRDEISEALKSVDYQSIRISGNYITTNGARLDLGGIAKGYIADRLLEFFEQKDIKRGVINLGGNVLVFGDEAHKVSVKKPFSENAAAAQLELSNKSVVTSGVYERYIKSDDKLYHHILDPKTGYPAETDLYSATVIADSSVDADALATICILLGEERATELMESLDGIEALFINNEQKISHSSGIYLEEGIYKLK